MNVDRRAPVRARQVAALAAALLLATCGQLVAAERLAARTFTTADGLGSSFVSHIIQDSAGYMWFATRDGLSRWNGYEFTTVSDGFSNPAIARLRQSRSGTYYVISNDGSLYTYDPAEAGLHGRKGAATFRKLSVRVAGGEVEFSRLYEDSHGVLWGGGRGVLIKGVGTVNTPIELKRQSAPLDAAVVVTALVEDLNGSLWIGTSWGLYRLAPDGQLAHFALAPQVAGDFVSTMALDRSGRVWVGHSSMGLIVLQPGATSDSFASRPLVPRTLAGPSVPLNLRPGESVLLTNANGLPDSVVTAIVVTSDGQVWLGSNKGLTRFDGVRFTRYTKDNGLSDNLVHSLCEDGDGNLWVGTPTGAMRLALSGFAGYTVAEGLASDYVASLGETSTGAVFTIGLDWTVSTFDGQQFRVGRLPVPKGRSLMWASQVGFLDRKGRWWGLTYQGLYRFDPASVDKPEMPSRPGRLYDARDGLPNSKAFRTYEDRSGFIWVATRTGDPRDDGLARLNPIDHRATTFGPTDGLPPHLSPSAFTEDRQGNLWIGFYQGGLARYRDGRFRIFPPSDAIPQGMVTGLVLDGKGRLWFSTTLGGLGRVDDPSADLLATRVYTTRDGLGSNNLRALAVDRFDRVFAGGARGVDRLDPDTGRIRHYSAADGLVSDFVTAAFRDSRGDLWFGTYGGVYRLRPGQEPKDEAPPIAITAVRIAGGNYPVQELGDQAVSGIDLASDQRDVVVEFLSVSRHQVPGLAYQYSVDAAHTAWSRPTKERQVNFAQLAPGEYTVAIRAVTPGGTVSRVPATVAFRIRPPVWRQWWALCLEAAALGGVLGGLYRYRVRRLLEMERLRLAIASDLHDEIATNLSSIAMFSAVVRNSLPAPSPPLDRITALAAESVAGIREIIWSIDPKPETVASLLVRLRDAMVTASRARGLHLTVSFPPDGMTQNLTPEQRKNLWLMLKEAVNNAIKHSGGSELHVSAVPVGHQVRLIVQDNGRGMSASVGSPGRGRATMKARTEALGGRMTTHSNAGEGTTIEFLVTLRK